MSQELERQVIQPQEVATVQSVDLLAVVARAASDPSIDVGKMQALLDMQRSLMRDRAEVEFKAALARIQPRMPRVTRNGKIEVGGQVRSRFARYEDVDHAIRPLLAEEGFAIDFDTQHEDKALRVILRVSHRDGHSETRQITLPLDASGSKNATQGVGSTMQYGKRYLLCGFFNIVTTDEDDDGMGGCISEDQARTIETLLHDSGSNREKFLKWVGAASIDAIPTAKFKSAVETLQGKVRR